MKKKIFIMAALAVAGLLNLNGASVFAQDQLPGGVSSGAVGGSALENAKAGINSTGTGTGNANVNEIIKNVVGIMMFMLGALAVIMIVWSGIQYVISAGDSAKVTKAKNTLIYSVVGLVVAIMAYAIVNFVLTNIK